MSKIVDIDPNKRMNKQTVEDIITQLRSLPADKIQSIFLVLSAEAPSDIKNAESNTVFYTHHYNIGFGMIGFLETNLSMLKIDSLEDRYMDDPFSKDPKDPEDLDD